MYTPITSEITLQPGMVLREISSEQLFRITERLLFRTETPGEDTWKITPAESDSNHDSALILTRRQLAEMYFAEVED